MIDRRLISAVALVRDGRMFIPHRARFDAALASVRDCRVILSLTEEAGERSRQLEKYYWAVCVRHVSEAIGEDEDRAHALLKALHLPRGLHAHLGGSICWHCARVLEGTTRMLSTWEQQRYVENIQRWAIADIGVYLPDPNEEVVAA